MTVIVLIIIIFALFVAIILERMRSNKAWGLLEEEALKLRETNTIVNAILKNVHAYILLIDTDFIVLKTNYYNLTRTKQDGLKRVGDLLQCSNALSVPGGCGTSPSCLVCPIRRKITETIESKGRFSNLIAELHVVVDEGKTANIIASISGVYLKINNEGRMVLTVHDITSQNNARQLLNQSAKEQISSAE